MAVAFTNRNFPGIVLRNDTEYDKYYELGFLMKLAKQQQRKKIKSVVSFIIRAMKAIYSKVRVF